MKLSNKLLIAAIAATLAGVTQSVSARTEKVDVCHNGRTLNIASAALAAHLGHGDTEGACAVAEEPGAEEPTAEEPVAEGPATEEPVAEEPATEEPVAEEPTAEEPVAEEETPAEEVVAEEPQDPRELEDIPPVDEIEGAIPAEPTHEEIVAQLLIKAGGLTEASFESGFLLLPEVQISVFGITISYAVVLEEVKLEDGTTTLVVAAAKEVESREGVVSATYSLESGQAIIPVVNVAVPEEAATEEALAEEVATEETATEEATTEEAPILAGTAASEPADEQI